MTKVSNILMTNTQQLLVACVDPKKMKKKNDICTPPYKKKYSLRFLYFLSLQSKDIFTWLKIELADCVGALVGLVKVESVQAKMVIHMLYTNTYALNLNRNHYE